MEVHIERGRIRAILPNTLGVTIRTENSVFNFPGAVLLPGFVDSHCHVVGFGTRLLNLSLHNASSAAMCVELLRNAPVSGEGWILAMGWNETNWNGNRVPDKSLLDEYFADVAVVAMRVDGHSSWVNSEALRRAKLHSATGILRESETQRVLATMPEPSLTELQQRIILAGNYCLQKGITEVHDMDVSPQWIEAFRDLAERGALPIRVQSFVSAQNDEWSHQGLLPSGGEFHRLAGIKVYSDGALGSGTAALLEPYRDEPSSLGTLLLTSEQIVAKVSIALDAGWSCIAVHAIGDRAAREVLDAFEAIRSLQDGKDVVLRMEHAQIVSEADVERLAKLNVWCSVQPSHAISDAAMVEQRLNASQMKNAYRWKSFIDAGCRITAGSDFPIELPDPLLGIDAFVRRIPHGSNHSWYDRECITVNQSLQAFTSWGHQAADLGYRRGSVEVGFDADLVVLDTNPTTCKPENLSEIKILATFVAGHLRYCL
ncbi:MAG: amidohydrolase [Ignavibacteria bacterium]|nr:amidohydrolase [Ignavibacteria bacterium]